MVEFATGTRSKSDGNAMAPPPDSDMATKAKAKRTKSRPPELKKVRTGIRGLDEVTLGGLPQGRPTLICGSAGCGKTLLSMEILIRGAVEHGEPGVFMSFEESSKDIAANVASLGFD